MTKLLELALTRARRGNCTRITRQNGKLNDTMQIAKKKKDCTFYRLICRLVDPSNKLVLHKARG